jgi:hypothetical protein
MGSTSISDLLSNKVDMVAGKSSSHPSAFDNRAALLADFALPPTGQNE